MHVSTMYRDHVSVFYGIPVVKTGIPVCECFLYGYYVFYGFSSLKQPIPCHLNKKWHVTMHIMSFYSYTLKLYYVTTNCFHRQFFCGFIFAFSISTVVHSNY